jgi:hypothetical protein
MKSIGEGFAANCDSEVCFVVGFCNLLQINLFCESFEALIV